MWFAEYVKKKREAGREEKKRKRIHIHIVLYICILRFL